MLYVKTTRMPGQLDFTGHFLHHKQRRTCRGVSERTHGVESIAALTFGILFQKMYATSTVSPRQTWHCDNQVCDRMFTKAYCSHMLLATTASWRRVLPGQLLLRSEGLLQPAAI
jgi:hypothetical protein